MRTIEELRKEFLKKHNHIENVIRGYIRNNYCEGDEIGDARQTMLDMWQWIEQVIKKREESNKQCDHDFRPFTKHFNRCIHCNIVDNPFSVK